MIGGIEEPETDRNAEGLGAGLFECLLEAGEFLPVSCVIVLCVATLCLVGGVVCHPMLDPNAVDVASRLDALSINPDKWFPGP
jgi:hypothetical protein